MKVNYKITEQTDRPELCEEYVLRLLLYVHITQQCNSYNSKNYKITE